MAKRKSLFIKATEEKKLLQVKLPAELLARAEQVNTDLQSIRPDLKFDKTLIVEQALEEAIEAAQAELKRLKENAADALPA